MDALRRRGDTKGENKNSRFLKRRRGVEYHIAAIGLKVRKKIPPEKGLGRAGVECQSLFREGGASGAMTRTHVRNIWGGRKTPACRITGSLL